MDLRGESFWLAGVDDTMVGLEDLPLALAGSSDDEFKLLLAHIQSFCEGPPAFLSTSCSVVIHTAARSPGDRKKAVQVARDEGCCGGSVVAATRKFT